MEHREGVFGMDNRELCAFECDPFEDTVESLDIIGAERLALALAQEAERGSAAGADGLTESAACG
jgi:hypothetical protein